ncbi:hypothetical protein CPB86DRAFT_787281 [Serendipita vermifera]|nr:hypothetical protein CPB86DRAFT_787281 [Serendipita vermifera]
MHPSLELSTVAKTFRQVNRTFCTICTPIVYEYINVLEDITDIEKLNRISQSITPYSRHIHILYIYVDCISSYLSWDVEQSTASIISACTQLTTLGLYYYHGSGWPRVSQAVVLLAEKGRLANIGVYSCAPKVYSTVFEVDAVGSLIQGLSKSQCAREAIKTLELAMEGISMETFATIRTLFSSLQSLTLRSTLRLVIDAKWDREQAKYWAPCHHIRRLQLISCQKRFANHISFLFNQFSGLKELVISGTTDDDWSIDWNRPPNEPLRARKPLDLLHIENMEEQEILQVIQIPTATLMVTAIRLRSLVKALKEDPMSFPGVKVLRLQSLIPPIAMKFPHQQRLLEQELFGLCHQRVIEIQQDATPIFYFGRGLYN